MGPGGGVTVGKYVPYATGDNESFKKLFTSPSDLNNWTSLYSLYRNIATPEQAFAIISESAYRLTDEDTQDMIKMLEQGMKLEEVGQIYGMTKAGISARISRYKKKDLSDGNLKRSSAN